MPPSKTASKSKQAEPQPEPLPQPSYPAIEAFVERASSGDAEAALEQIQEGLAGLKGPRAQQAKKVETAISRTRELLAYLVEVREKLEGEKKDARKSRK